MKTKQVLALNSDENPVATNEPMDWLDALKVSLVLMMSQVFIVFLPKYSAAVIEAEMIKFLYELFVFAGSSFFAAFIALAGLTVIYKPPTPPPTPEPEEEEKDEEA